MCCAVGERERYTESEDSREQPNINEILHKKEIYANEPRSMN